MEQKINKYRNWDILEEIPKGWIVDKTAGSPLKNTVFITNGKSVLNGQKRALLKVQTKQNDNTLKNEIINHDVEVKEMIDDSDQYIFPAKTVNQLARLKFQEQLLKEIRFDLIICDLENWDKKEYLNEIKKLLNSIKL